MDVIWNCAFGFDIDIQQKDDDLDYFLKSEDVFKKTESLNIFSFISCKKNEINKNGRVIGIFPYDHEINVNRRQSHLELTVWPKFSK